MSGKVQLQIRGSVYCRIKLRPIFNPYIVIDDRGFDGKHINGIIDLNNKYIGVRQSFL